MDPLTAVGLASNIIQFVDFARSIVSDAKRFYDTTSGAKDEYQEAGKYAQRLQRLAARVATPQATHGGNLSEEEKELKELGEQCSQIANELFEATKDITASSHKDWVRSAKKAIKARLSSSQIKSLQTRLDRISQQFTGERLLTQLKHTETALNEIAAENRRLALRSNEDIHHLQEQLQHVMKTLERGERQRDVEISLAGIAETGAQFSAEQFLLGRLFFLGMNERHTNVHVEHEKTLSWIFNEDSPVRFAEFLETQSSLYWISGKPGSGKSTAMKYICQHSETKRRLEQWANGSSLVVAKYFFWNAGKSSLLKSQEGLIQSILYQIFRAAPALIPHAFPDEWAAYLSGNNITSSSSTGSFSVTQLVAAIQLLCAHLSDVNIKICIFIDGLDEYDGRPGDVIRLIEALKTSANLKACVSSRPWNEFERAFGQDQANKLYMQDLTKSDIRKYVRDTLENNETFRELVESEGEASSMVLVHDIVDAAQGVFLWVILVVRSLLEGLTNNDKLSNMQQRVRELPKDLDEYFDRILFSVDDFYRSQSAAMCLVTLTATTPLPLMSYWFMDQDDSKYALQLEVQPMQPQSISSRLKTMKKRLNAYCKGLLEITQDDTESYESVARSNEFELFTHKVDFLHRTVRDFFGVRQTQARLLDRLPNNFNPHMAIFQALLAQIKTMPKEKIFFASFGLLHRLITIIFNHAKALEDEGISLQIEVDLMANLGATLKLHAKTMRVAIFNLYEKSLPDGFLSTCFYFGLKRYVYAMLDGDQKPSCDELSTLLLLSQVGGADDPLSKSQQHLTRVLFERGADPNFVVMSFGATPWTTFLDRMVPLSEENQAIAFRILEDYTKHGATLQSIKTGRRGGASEYRAWLKRSLSEEQFKAVLRLADSKRMRDHLVSGLREIPGLSKFLRKVTWHR